MPTGRPVGIGLGITAANRRVVVGDDPGHDAGRSREGFAGSEEPAERSLVVLELAGAKGDHRDPARALLDHLLLARQLLEIGHALGLQRARLLALELALLLLGEALARELLELGAELGADGDEAIDHLLRELSGRGLVGRVLAQQRADHLVGLIEAAERHQRGRVQRPGLLAQLAVLQVARAPGIEQLGELVGSLLVAADVIAALGQLEVLQLVRAQSSRPRREGERREQLEEQDQAWQNGALGVVEMSAGGLTFVRLVV